jgi:hypothetical protein
MKRILIRVVQGDEAVFRVQNFFQRLVDVLKELVEVGCFIQRVNDLENNLALGFHPLQIGYIQQANDDPRVAVTRVTARFGIKPPPAAVLTAKAAPHVDPGFQVRAQTAEYGAKQVQIVLMDQIGDRSAGHLDGSVAKNTPESGIYKEYGSIRVKDGDKLANAFE